MRKVAQGAHTCFDKLKARGLAYLVVKARRKAKQDPSEKAFAKMDVLEALQLAIIRQRENRIFLFDTEIAATIIHSYFGIDKACKYSQQSIADCSGDFIKLIDYFVEIAQKSLSPDGRTVSSLKNVAIKQVMALHQLNPWSVTSFRDAIISIFETMDTIPHQL